MELEEIDLRGLDVVDKLIKKGWTIQINHHITVMTKYLNEEWYEEKEYYEVQMGEINYTTILSEYHDTLRECFVDINDKARFMLREDYLE